MPVTVLTLTPVPPAQNYPSSTIYPGVTSIPGPAALTLIPVQ